MGAKAIGRPIARAASLLLDFVYPPLCLLCDADLRPGSDLVCARCWARALASPSARGRTLEAGIAHHPVFAAGPTLFGILHQAKYRGRRELIERFASEAASRLPRAGWEGARFVPVPLHAARRRCRGFNQSEILARAAAVATGGACATGWLKRTRDTRAQAKLAPSARSANVSGAFRLVRAAVPSRWPRRVVVVDDVVTSGATALECSRLLRGAGAPRIDILSLV